MQQSCGARVLVGRAVAVALASAVIGAASSPTGAFARRSLRAPADPVVLAQIRATLDSSAGAWNRGDLDGFMTSYAPGEGTTFVGRRGILRGPAAIRANYAPRFAPGAAPRGTLRFEGLEADVLAPNVSNVIAFYVLSVRTAAGADSTIARGPTTVVMRRLGAGWKIIHDHSS
ncbi:MAG TPA: nuclear transport factor 2 family protein [Gemmatirosa sp.]